MEKFGVTDVRPRPRVGPANGVEGVVGGGGGWDIPTARPPLLILNNLCKGIGAIAQTRFPQARGP